MSRIATLLGGLGVGVIAAYFFDPEKGNSRRAMVRDKAGAAWRVKQRALNAMVKDTRNRIEGVVHEAKAKVRPVTPTEIKLKDRIRSEIGHVLSHPKAIEVQVAGGAVRLSGCLLATEQKKLIAAVWGVPGVDAIEHKLRVFDSADGIPELQGDGVVDKTLVESVVGTWRPSTALVMGATGGVLALYGTLRKDTLGKALATVGVGMVTKSFNDGEGRLIAEKLLGNTSQ